MRISRLLAWTGPLVIAAAALMHNLPRLAPGLVNWAEPGNVAAALVQGRGFSDPFDGGTGPTAWVSPLPVWLEAAVFVFFGVKTIAAARALLVLCVLGLSAANAFLVSALRPHGERLATGASAAFLAYCVLLPAGPLVVLSEAWLDLLLSAALLWAALETRRTPDGPGRIALIALAVLAPLDNAGLALSTAIVLLALGWRFRSDLRRFTWTAAAAVAALAAVGGWTVRNAAALGRFVPLKSNFWFELHLANVDSGDGLPRMETVLRRLPYFDVHEFNRYAALGEPAYVATFRAPAEAALRAHPFHFAANIGRRLLDATVFCKREGGGEFTRFSPPSADRQHLVDSGEFISLGAAAGGFWTRIDTPPLEEAAKLHALGLGDETGAWSDWVAKRAGYNAQFRGPAGILTGFLTAGIPVLALVLAALFGRGRLDAAAGWAAAIGFGMVPPFVIINHNDRHQVPLMAMQAVSFGAFAQALADRRRNPR